MRMRTQINIVFYGTFKRASKFATQEFFCNTFDLQVAMLRKFARSAF